MRLLNVLAAAHGNYCSNVMVKQKQQWY